MEELQHAVLFGGLGSIGSCLRLQLEKADWAISSFDISASDLFSKCDATSEEACSDAILRAHELHGPITSVVSLVGVYGGLTLETITKEYWQTCFEINVLSQYWISKTYLEYCANFPLNNYRTLILTSSAASGLPGSDVAYASSKAACEALVRCTSRIASERGVAMLGIAPGILDSPMARIVSEERQRKHMQSNYWGSWADPCDIAEIIQCIQNRQAFRTLAGSILNASSGSRP